MVHSTSKLVPALLGFPELDKNMIRAGFQHDVLTLPCFVEEEPNPNVWPRIYVSKFIAPLLAEWSRIHGAHDPIYEQAYLQMAPGPFMLVVGRYGNTAGKIHMEFHRGIGDLFQVGTYGTRWMQAIRLDGTPVKPAEHFRLGLEAAMEVLEESEDPRRALQEMTDGRDPAEYLDETGDDEVHDDKPNPFERFEDEGEEVESGFIDVRFGPKLMEAARRQKELREGKDPVQDYLDKTDDHALIEYFQELEEANLAEADPEDGPAELKDVLLEEHTMPEPWMRPAKGEQS